MAMSVEGRILAKIQKGSGCWIWTGGTSVGKPVVRLPSGRYRGVPRHIWESEHGPIVGDMVLKRECEGARCVRPDHFRLMPRKRAGTEPMPETKRCRACQTVKPVAEFPRTAQKVDGLRSYCHPCARGRSRGYNLLRYGIGVGDYERLLDQQGGMCAVCATPRSDSGRDSQLCVDHDHATGVVRGLLCHPCNVAIGLAKDDPVRLRAMAKYLEEHQ